MQRIAALTSVHENCGCSPLGLGESEMCGASSSTSSTLGFIFGGFWTDGIVESRGEVGLKLR